MGVGVLPGLVIRVRPLDWMLGLSNRRLLDARHRLWCRKMIEWPSRRI